MAKKEKERRLSNEIHPHTKMFQKEVVIDGRAHMLGRLASILAKELLSGQRVTVVRAEEILISGSLVRNKLQYHDFLRKRTATNHSRGPFHLRSPSKMLWRAIRGMLPHKTPRGAEALARLRVFEGIPSALTSTKRVVVPDALKVTRIKPGRRVTVLGRLSTEVGWKFAPVVKKLEENRKLGSAAYYQRKKALLRLRAKAVANHTAENAQLAKLGF
ncbi:putative cytosolic ribosomal protein L16 [Planoprotostelium fungivorum]|uniref:Putative cytosolic ribosomal protein L16 n=1 Tax=Planoprotostelium fungivorum TaxID=1890364 RepID=A0A2P6NVX9_9EUKA|nr:putative cytosolic ribosomal protein L16 [Planoprotostelium fungivorum]